MKSDINECTKSVPKYVDFCICSAQLSVYTLLTFKHILSSSAVGIVLNNYVHAVFETLHYETEGSGFVSRWCHWKFSLT